MARNRCDCGPDAVLLFLLPKVGENRPFREKAGITKTAAIYV